VVHGGLCNAQLWTKGTVHVVGRGCGRDDSGWCRDNSDGGVVNRGIGSVPPTPVILLRRRLTPTVARPSSLYWQDVQRSVDLYRKEDGHVALGFSDSSGSNEASSSSVPFSFLHLSPLLLSSSSLRWCGGLYGTIE
jgi:hypothetical protein